jgi:hypothetical protein
MSMDTFQIRNMLRSDDIVRTILLGVIPINHLPRVSFRPAALIINLDTSDMPGSHWVSLYFYDSCCDFFDSYGRPPNEILTEYMLKFSNKIFFNNKPVQALLTSTCGQHCIFFLFWRARSVPMSNIVGILDIYNADQFITGFVNSLFKVQTSVYDENFLVNQISEKWINFM